MFFQFIITIFSSNLPLADPPNLLVSSTFFFLNLCFIISINREMLIQLDIGKILVGFHLLCLQSLIYQQTWQNTSHKILLKMYRNYLGYEYCLSNRMQAKIAMNRRLACFIYNGDNLKELENTYFIYQHIIS